MEDFFNSYECFKNLSEEDIKLFNDQKTQVTYYKGETIIKQGAFADYVIFVNDGLARKYNQKGLQKQINLRLIKKGDFLAYFTIFGENIYPYSVVALKETKVCMIDKLTFKELLVRNPLFALEMTSRNYKREHRYLDIIYDLTYKQMRGKLASALLYLSSEQFHDEDVFEYLTRQEIADFASITIESAIKFIKEFEKENLLSIENKKIVIKSTKGLEEVSRVG
ncbi:Crp/Fnr family transcriptional regulator [Carboxylicivirga sp. M1479]|uniref:Crp/Fnr family transcriptional regulator n=1 Tax=Carboxylicivirga sp. M1479 TaxID=2594476 RepID=UPI00117786ED|nr:Crp/Fnr family transcriptional regulator [Carboxylicivirga sp. M1479]TRX72598.1 Crp/Fnr family transcriptional regulator [Carboxylicivirga sp. M1479]